METLTINLKIIWILCWAMTQPWEMRMEYMRAVYSWTGSAFTVWSQCAHFDYWVQIGNLAIHDVPSPCDWSEYTK